MTLNEAELSRTVQCPRCGYDLRAQCAEWTDVCPLQGRCTECGLPFDWAHALDPQLVRARWYVESIHPPRPLVLQTVQTTARVLMPWSFWRRIPLALPSRWRRLLAALALHLVALYLAFTALVAMHIGDEALILRSTYATLSPADRVNVDEPPTLIAAVARVVVNPFDPGLELRSPVRLGSPRPGTRAPVYFTRQRRVLDTRQYHWHLSAEPFRYAGYALVANAMTALAFVTLPVTRRRCRVRVRHIARVLLTVAFPLTLLLVPLVHGPLAIDAIEYAHLQTSRSIFPFALAGFSVLWWWMAVRCYLRFPHALLVAFCLSVIGWLIIPTVTLANVLL